MELVLASFKDYSAIYKAVVQLKETGLTADEISVVSQYRDDDDVEYGEEFNMITDTKEDLVEGVSPERGEFGKLAALINQGTIMDVPDLEATIIFGSLTNEVSGASSKRILGALVEHGINRDIAEKIEAELQAGHTIVTVENNKLKEAVEILKSQGANISIY